MTAILTNSFVGNSKFQTKDLNFKSSLKQYQVVQGKLRIPNTEIKKCSSKHCCGYCEARNIPRYTQGNVITLAAWDGLGTSVFVCGAVGCLYYRKESFQVKNHLRLCTGKTWLQYRQGMERFPLDSVLGSHYIVSKMQ